jgi:hypothetical protein
MRWNVFQFGDTHWKQLSGTAMGTPPACVYATLYFSIHELAMPAALQACLIIYKRYIDNGIGIWTGTDHQWLTFQRWINSFGSLRWTFTALARQIDYLDVTIRLDARMSIRFTLFENPLNLYLYLPPHSAHPPGVLTGLVYGMIRRAYRLTTDPTDCQAYLRKFYTRPKHPGCRNGQKPWPGHCGSYDVHPQSLHQPPIRSSYLPELISPRSRCCHLRTIHKNLWIR